MSPSSIRASAPRTLPGCEATLHSELQHTHMLLSLRLSFHQSWPNNRFTLASLMNLTLGMLNSHSVQHNVYISFPISTITECCSTPLSVALSRLSLRSIHHLSLLESTLQFELNCCQGKQHFLQIFHIKSDWGGEGIIPPELVGSF